jgi:hypothetical protein
VPDVSPDSVWEEADIRRLIDVQPVSYDRVWYEAILGAEGVSPELVWELYLRFRLVSVYSFDISLQSFELERAEFCAAHIEIGCAPVILSAAAGAYSRASVPTRISHYARLVRSVAAFAEPDRHVAGMISVLSPGHPHPHQAATSPRPPPQGHHERSESCRHARDRRPATTAVGTP